VPWRAVGLAVALGGSGVLHLVRPRTFEWLVPPELGDARSWVTGSGLVELGTAALLAVPVTRRAGGWTAAALLTAFLPAHVHTFRVVPRRPLPLAAAVLRLPLQAPLIAAALRVARELTAPRRPPIAVPTGHGHIVIRPIRLRTL
jgi:uncharacterized membrane protein